MQLLQSYNHLDISTQNTIVFELDNLKSESLDCEIVAAQLNSKPIVSFEQLLALGHHTQPLTCHRAGCIGVAWPYGRAEPYHRRTQGPVLMTQRGLRCATYAPLEAQ